MKVMNSALYEPDWKLYIVRFEEKLEFVIIEL